MNGYLIDTNVLSELRRPVPAQSVIRWVSSTDPGSLFLSVLTLGEIVRGAELLRIRDERAARALDAWTGEIRTRFAERILPVDVDVAECWARLSPRQPLPVVDGFLAATATVHRLTVVTRNGADFERAGVPILNPFDPGSVVA